MCAAGSDDYAEQNWLMTDDPNLEISQRIKQALVHVRGQSEGVPLNKNSAVTVNFHPDAEHCGGIMIASLARDGVYRSQFETGISNGALAKHPDAGRRLWERQIFGGAYEHCDPADRPKYGALSYMKLPVGASPRFGSAHLRLKSHVLKRTTFCFPDSHMGAQYFGTADHMGLVDRLDDYRAIPDPLDHYVEAHVHGSLEIERSVDAVVLDPSHRGTEVEDAAHNLGCPVEWHHGFRMTVAQLSDCVSYRGEEAASLAISLFEDDVLTPAILGAARRAKHADPKTFKHLWHCLARFGSPVIL